MCALSHLVVDPVPEEAGSGVHGGVICTAVPGAGDTPGRYPGNHAVVVTVQGTPTVALERQVRTNIALTTNMASRERLREMEYRLRCF